MQCQRPSGNPGATHRSVCSQSLPRQIYARAAGIAFRVKYGRVRTTHVGNRTFNALAL